MCDKCRTIADEATPAPMFVRQPDGTPEITVADSDNAEIVFLALDLYTQVYLAQSERLSEMATNPVASITHMQNAINTTERVCAMMESLRPQVHTTEEN